MCANLSIMEKAARICIGYDVKALMQMQMSMKTTIELIGTRLIVKIG